MAASAGLPSSTDSPAELPATQLALAISQRTHARLKTGSIITGGRVRNGAQVFLNVPYALQVPRWSDPQPIPDDYLYPDNEYVFDALYCTQPQGTLPRLGSSNTNIDRHGLGSPTDNPFLADIYVPSQIDLMDPKAGLLPVKVFIHGGFLQIGSKSGSLYSGQQHCAEVRKEVRILISYRLSVLGFLAAKKPKLEGNYGLKDIWVALEWIKGNVSSFGGDSAQIHLAGLSGGGHAVAQMLHQVSHRSPARAPFVTATLHSNAILSNPQDLDTAQKQFEVLCRMLDLEPHQNDVLERLRDTSSGQLMEAVGNMGQHNTFRPAYGQDEWLKELVMHQRSSTFAEGLQSAGVKSVLLTEVSEEQAFYRFSHPSTASPNVGEGWKEYNTRAYEELLQNLNRYYQPSDAQALAKTYPILPPCATRGDIDGLLGQMLADGQVYIPTRQLARDLLLNGFPCIRLQTRFLSNLKRQSSPYVVHGSDLVLHQLRLPTLTPEEVAVSVNLLDTLDKERAKAEKGELHRADEMLCLMADGKIEWLPDDWYPMLMRKEAALRHI
ncbi:MAG: hypothetical protein CYPHOPRED_001542 [Cyphobasidiales sp. Tagirdzhanova-0007]|nr:MAG: hypothetical protein CYPHOPRED_001542 [Cyphobasidiales sp. Tagirdzhanova-0007]